MQFRVPQNIAMEDRIIGPLTAIQFGILVLGGGAAFLIYTSQSLPKPLNAILGGLLAILTLVLSVGKFNDQPMYRFFRYVLAFVFTPKVRIWHKGGGEINLVRAGAPKKDQRPRQQPKHVSKADLAQLATVLDSRGQAGMVPQNALPPTKKKGK